MPKNLLLSMPLYRQKKDEINTWLSQFVENSVWINSRLKQLKVKYPDQYIVVYDKKVIKSGNDPTQLRLEVREELGETEGIAIEFISSKPLKLLL